jgi:hypothetical protein
VSGTPPMVEKWILPPAEQATRLRRLTDAHRLTREQAMAKAPDALFRPTRAVAARPSMAGKGHRCIWWIIGRPHADMPSAATAGSRAGDPPDGGRRVGRASHPDPPGVYVPGRACRRTGRSGSRSRMASSTQGCQHGGPDDGAGIARVRWFARARLVLRGGLPSPRPTRAVVMIPRPWSPATGGPRVPGGLPRARPLAAPT